MDDVDKQRSGAYIIGRKTPPEYWQISIVPLLIQLHYFARHYEHD